MYTCQDSEKGKTTINERSRFRILYILCELRINQCLRVKVLSRYSFALTGRRSYYILPIPRLTEPEISKRCDVDDNRILLLEIIWLF